MYNVESNTLNISQNCEINELKAFDEKARQTNKKDRATYIHLIIMIIIINSSNGGFLRRKVFSYSLNTLNISSQTKKIKTVNITSEKKKTLK